MHKSINKSAQAAKKITTVALTGGIACGKTVVSDFFADFGVPIIDLDDLAKLAVKPNSKGLTALVKAFGETILAPDKTLNRTQLKRLLFDNKDNKKTIDAVLHPLIIVLMNEKITQLQQQGVDKVLVVVPLLVETKMQDLFDKVIVVSCTPTQQKQRLAQRDGLSDDYINNILASQATNAQRLAINPAYVIDNISDKTRLKAQVKGCYEVIFKNS